MQLYFGEALINERFTHTTLDNINKYNETVKSSDVITYLGDLAIITFGFGDNYAHDFLSYQRDILNDMV